MMHPILGALEIVNIGPGGVKEALKKAAYGPDRSKLKA
jgi:hypothetical protein